MMSATRRRLLEEHAPDERFGPFDTRPTAERRDAMVTHREAHSAIIVAKMLSEIGELGVAGAFSPQDIANGAGA